MTRRNAVIALALAGGLALGAGVYFGQSDRWAGSVADAGQSAATLLALTLPDPAGKPESLGQWQGKVLVVNFWATWCAPCREEMPEFVRAQDEFGGKGLQFVGIAIDEADKVRQFGEAIGVNYPLLVGGYGAMELSRSFGNRVMALPFTIIVGRDGNIAHVQLGPLPDTKLRLFLGKLI